MTDEALIPSDKTLLWNRLGRQSIIRGAELFVSARLSDRFSRTNKPLQNMPMSETDHLRKGGLTKSFLSVSEEVTRCMNCFDSQGPFLEAPNFKPGNGVTINNNTDYYVISSLIY